VPQKIVKLTPPQKKRFSDYAPTTTEDTDSTSLHQFLRSFAK